MVQPPPNSAPIPFDARSVTRNRDRAAPGFGAYDFLWREVADRLADRLLDMTRTFSLAAELGARDRNLNEILQGRGGVNYLLRLERSEAMARAAKDGRAVANPEFLPLGIGQIDLILSILDLHWVNDLPGALWQINRALRPDGLFLASMFGGDTLADLRQCLMEAELSVTGGASPRIAPFVDVRDAGQLLQRAGFALPIVDCETITVEYDDAFALMRDLRGMGETNALTARLKHFTRRAVMFEAAKLYQGRCATPQGRVSAKFEIISMTAWRPDISQQKPLRPGSAKASLAEALGGIEKSAGEKAGS